MSFQTSLSQIPDEQFAHLSTEFITPLGDAVLAQSKLSAMDWLPARMNFAANVREAQWGKTVVAGRVGLRHHAPTSRALTLAEAQQRLREAGVEGRVKVFEGQREEALRLEIEREQTKQKYEQIVAHADQGWGTQFLIGATGVAVDFADPVNLATMAIPGVGAGKVVYGLTKATAKLAPAASKIIVRAGTGAYEGAVSTVIAEPLNYAVHQSLGDDYGLADSAKNVVTNAVGGGALHVTGGAGLDLYRGMRAPRGLGLDGTDPVAVGLYQLSAMEPVTLPRLIDEEQAALTHASLESSPAILPPSKKKRTGLGYARNSILIMPASSASGERVTIYDLASLNAVLREYDPVTVGGRKGDAAVYRIERDGEIVVYTQSSKVAGNPTTYTVERLRADDITQDVPFSQKKAPDASDGSGSADRLLYLHPPKALAERLSETLETSVSALEKLEAEQLFHRFQPSGSGGHTVNTDTGASMHGTFTAYVHGTDELHLLPMENGAIPDAGITGTQLTLDAKPDTQRGRRNGQETARKYREKLNQDTVTLLYDVKHHEGRIAALSAKVEQAWDFHRPTWRKELEARKAADAEAKKLGTPSKKKQKQAERQQKLAERLKRQAERQQKQAAKQAERQQKQVERQSRQRSKLGS